MVVRPNISKVFNIIWCRSVECHNVDKQNTGVSTVKCIIIISGVYGVTMILKSSITMLFNGGLERQSSKRNH